VEVQRATFEQVNEWQLDFLFGKTGIETLIEKKETIGKNSRRIFFDLFAKSLLGKGLDYNYILKYDDGVYNLGSLSIFARKMAYFEDTSDKKQEIILKGKKIRIPIEQLWIAFRESIYKPMDEALTLALRSSAEIPVKRGGTYSIGTDGKGKKQSQP